MPVSHGFGIQFSCDISRIWYTQCTFSGSLIPYRARAFKLPEYVDSSIGNLNTDHLTHLEMKSRFISRIWEMLFGIYLTDLVYTVHFVLVSNYR